ncbi:portal protein [Tritonibacter mobilis]|uniref:portal protein n=2 Tax=Tritonibacter mobilis TaxID=379347 RepID=UPI000806CA9D|nr:portal protein [Tritonibacter mobilis]
MMQKPAKPSKEFSTRYDAAKRWRDSVKPKIEEIYSFICPGREHDFDRGENETEDYDQETFVSLPEELATDFASDLVTYYTPAEATWAEYLVTAPVPQDAVKQVKDLVSQREEDIQDMIQSSNYNDVAPQVMFELNHGTAAMWVEAGHLGQPLYVETVPPHELLITPGHLGILDRFREKKVLASTLPALFAGWEDISLEDQRIKNKTQKPGQFVELCYGFWVDWSDPGNPVWLCEVTVDQIRVSPQTPINLGTLAGSCPLLVGRFNPQPGRPWGRGPAWKSLPDMRVLNAVDEAVLDGLDQSLKNTILYADDGFIDLSEGVEAGAAYPASRGFTREQVYELNKGVNLDMGFFSEERLEGRLRERFYQDGPRQRGDTPPTASQWIDERRRVQVRIGKPSAPLWRELFLPFIQRVEKIGVESGKLDAELTHNEDVISAQPISPLQKAQNQDKVMVSKSNLSTAFEVFGEGVGQVVDVAATMENHIRVSGDELTVIRKQDPNETAPPTE